MKLEFRKLRADEIDCRIGQIKENGLSLLLYKDARCDMNVLDETVGAMNWKREHTRDNKNCIVSIYDVTLKQWIQKEDTGTESYAEKEKGLASDSFKRACFNWGIGRELYTAPFTWVSKEKANIYDTKRKDKNGNTIYSTTDKFYVEKIEITDKVITGLSIKNNNDKRVFVYKK